MTYDEAMELRTVSFAEAQRELKRHGMDCMPAHLSDGTVIEGMIDVFNPLDYSDTLRIPCNSKVILEWLGY